VIRVGCAKAARPHQKSRYEAVVQSLFPHSVTFLVYLFYMAFASNSDESSESEYEIDETQQPESDHEDEGCEPEVSQEIQDFNDISWSPQAQLNADQLAQLHRNIKASAELPIPAYQELPRS
jgi:hypothetical protein